MTYQKPVQSQSTSFEKAIPQLSQDQRKIIGHDGSMVLEAIAYVSHEAKAQLEKNPRGGSQDVFASNANSIVDGRKAEQKMSAIQSDTRKNLLKLTQEPFIACIEVQWDDLPEGQSQKLYITRASAAGLSKAGEDGMLASYRAPIGRLAEFGAGEPVSITINNKEKDGVILKRILLTPSQRDGVWDALEDKFEFPEWEIELESLRRFISEVSDAPVALHPEQDLIGRLLDEAVEANLIRQAARRKIVDQMALRDQPILDRFQGDIFRLPLDQQVLLFGPPGSGKTTTLIRRLAQKRTPESLTQDEEAMFTPAMRDIFLTSDSWAMFSPTELLKLYLQDAFNREDVPAADVRNLRTWEKERADLARNVLKIFKTANSGKFQPDITKTLKDISSSGLCTLYNEFEKYIEENILRQCAEAFEYLSQATDTETKKKILILRRSIGTGQFSIKNILELLDGGEYLQVENKRLSDLILKEQKDVINKILSADIGILNEIIQHLQNILGEEEAEEEEEQEEADEILDYASNASAQSQAAKLLMGAVKAWARAVVENRRVSGRAGKIIKIIGNRLPPNDVFVNLGKNIVTRSHLRTLIQSPRTFVFGLPSMYARFRRQSLKQNDFFSADVVSLVDKNRISPEETDVLILAMLKNSRELLLYADGRRMETTQSDWLESIKNRYLMQVFVDEATDLSAIQLACTIALTHPKICSWFACGDLRQRITAGGIQGTNDIEWLNRTLKVSIQVRDINIGYRQSQNLRMLADVLSEMDTGVQSITEPPKGNENSAEVPLLGEHLSGKTLAEWLTNRIKEVEKNIGKLPSIAIFVDGDERIDGLVSEMEPLLSESSIPIIGCKEGRVVGNASEVRVFDIRHIKGLEFEAVFFVDIDDFALRAPQLFHRFFYVGVTRAATYLGVTCRDAFPPQLEGVKKLFRAGSWAK